MYEKLAGMTGTKHDRGTELMEIYKLDVVGNSTHRSVVRKDHDDLIYKTKREKYNAVLIKLDLSDKQPVLVGTTPAEELQLFRLLRKSRLAQRP